MSAIDIQDAANLTSSIVSHAIVKPLGDPYTIGISGLIFDIIGRVEVRAQSDVTDHYVEQNYAIQDHVALKPIIVTMQGLAAEQVNTYTPNVLSQIFGPLAGLIPLPGLAPNFNLQDAEFYNELNGVVQLGQNVVNTLSSAFELFGNVATLVTRQQTVFQYLMNMWQTRQQCTVETPYAVFNNMIIEDLDSEQSEETTLVSEFTVRFKQILTVASIQGTTSVDSTDTQNSGTTSTTPTQAASVPGGGDIQGSVSPSNSPSLSAADNGISSNLAPAGNNSFGGGAGAFNPNANAALSDDPVRLGTAGGGNQGEPVFAQPVNIS